MCAALSVRVGKRSVASQILAYGYRHDEFNAPLPDFQRDVKIKQNNRQKSKTERKPFRNPMMASIGVANRHGVMPHVDLDDGETYLAGAIKRVILHKFRPSKKILRRMRALGREWAKQFAQIDPANPILFEEWLERSRYPEWRRAELREIRRKIDAGETKMPDFVNSFGKDEQYGDWKHLRTINARPDEWKVILGPYITAIEKVVFKDKSFAKYVPVHKRFEFLMERLQQPGARYQWTDHSSFESVFTNEMVEAIILPLYEHVFGRHPEGCKFLNLYRQATMPQTGHKLVSKFYTIEGAQFECSGEMDTSLKNGTGNKFSNDAANALTKHLSELFGALEVDLVLTALCDEQALDQWLAESQVEASSPGQLASEAGNTTIATDHNVVCEGDDGVEVASVPTASAATNALGFTVKMEQGFSLADGDFCCVDGDPDTGQTVTNPLKVLGHFGWLGQLYVPAKRTRKLELLRARALSLKASYPNAPIIGALADYVLRVTSHVDMRRFIAKERRVGGWKMEKFKVAMELHSLGQAVSQPTQAMRSVVESRYGVLTTHQLIMEQFFMEQTQLVFLDHYIFDIYMPPAWMDYASRYTVESQDNTHTHAPVVPVLFDNFGPLLRSKLLDQGIELA